jgi:predicted homoserine dehydrogenase-like protein
LWQHTWCRERRCRCRAPDGKWLETAGVVSPAENSGSAKGVMFITIEDENRRLKKMFAELSMQNGPK